MAKATLPTNYRDDILNVSTEGKRKYRMNYNDDGTVSFVDVTPYDQEGSDFGAGDINATNEAVNQSFDKSKLIRDMDAINALTQEGYAPDALALKDVNDSLTADNAQVFQFAYDNASGKYGYKVKEADTDVFVPFSKINVEKLLIESVKSSSGLTYDKTFTCSRKGCIYVDVVNDQQYGARPATVKHNGNIVAYSGTVGVCIDVNTNDTVQITFFYGEATVAVFYVA